MHISIYQTFCRIECYYKGILFISIPSICSKRFRWIELCCSWSNTSFFFLFYSSSKQTFRDKISLVEEAYPVTRIMNNVNCCGSNKSVKEQPTIKWGRGDNILVLENHSLLKKRQRWWVIGTAKKIHHFQKKIIWSLLNIILSASDTLSSPLPFKITFKITTNVDSK